MIYTRRKLKNNSKVRYVLGHIRNVIRLRFDGCTLVVSGKTTIIKSHRSRLSSTRNTVRNSSVVYGQSRVSHRTEEANAIRTSSGAVVSMADRIHPLSDLALHEPGEFTRIPENHGNGNQSKETNKTRFTSINQT